MLFLIWSLLLGSLGIEALVISRWLHQEEKRQGQRAEEETFIRYQFDDNINHLVATSLTMANDYQTNDPSNKAKNNSRENAWEYKIVRSNSDIFRNPEIFYRLCQEEAQAGWILLEKLDDQRVRFKRSYIKRDSINTKNLAFDPYRTQYGPSGNFINILGAIAFVTLMALPAYLGFMLVSSSLNKGVVFTPTITPANIPSATLAPTEEPTEYIPESPIENSPIPGNIPVPENISPTVEIPTPETSPTP
ncbi:MAG: hypothetical protein ACRC2J_13805 [Microcoleaceae cyanobacterium]